MKDSALAKISALAKRRGFIYPSSEIYGGLAGIYDYGPLGAQLVRNLKNLWWDKMVVEREDVFGLDGSILMHPRAWEASGHVTGFSDPLIDCEKCKKRFRPDKLPGWRLKKDDQGQFVILEVGETKCPDCGGKLSSQVRQFNVLMETSLGVIEGDKMKAYLKGESCQNLYLDYQNVVDSLSPQIPFGLAQIGKAFRNEITLGKFIFRTREFEQADVEYYVHPKEAAAAYDEWKQLRWDWYVKEVGLQEKNLRWRQHPDNERIFYASDAWDIDYKFPWGWDELEGVHDRGDYDLTQHAKFSGKKLEYRDPKTGESFVPHIVESSGGIGRMILAIMLDAYHEQEEPLRTYLSLTSKLAPYQVAVFPLMANKEELVNKARSIYQSLQKDWSVAWDDHSNVGKRYRRQDEAGTPWCLTVDYESLEDDSVTIRDRDSMAQERIPVGKLASYLKKQLD